MRPAHLPALTGIRFVAAAWVVAFHILRFNEDDLRAEHPFLAAVIWPIASQGDLGVDLFFMLSGFVLAHNYLSRLGPDPGVAATGRFLWARIARIWPLYVVAVLIGGLALLLRQVLFGSDPTVPLTFGKLAEQVLMIQQWTDPDVAYTSWTTPGWSISAEWLAYLSFPVLAVVVWRLQKVVGPRLLAGLAILTLLPLLVWMADAESQGEPWMWVGRLASEFTCGMLVAAALPTTPSTRPRSWGVIAIGISAGMVAWFYLVEAVGLPWLGAQVMVAFPFLIVALARGEGRLVDLLSTRALVVGGGLSYALYLVHSPMIKFFRDAEANTGWYPFEHRFYGEFAVAAVSVVIAYYLFRYVEEPARRALRDVVPPPAKGPTERAPERELERSST